MSTPSRQWQLSPAYDMTVSFNEDDASGEIHKMTINGRRDDFVFDDFIDVANNMGINKTEQIVKEILDVAARWPEFANQAGISLDVKEYIGNLLLRENSLDPSFSTR